MRTYALTMATAVLAAFLLIACGDDDDPGDDAAPTATDAPTATTPAGDDDGGSGDAVDGEDGAPSFSQDFGAEPAGNGGTGTIVIGEDTFEYEVIVCSTSDDGLTVWNGRGHTADGEPFVALVSVEFGSYATTEVGIGSESISDPGRLHWSAQPTLEYQTGQNGVQTLRFDSLIGSEETGIEGAVEGSVDVVCEP